MSIVSAVCPPNAVSNAVFNRAVAAQALQRVHKLACNRHSVNQWKNSFNKSRRI
jgi:hypothetical protein